MIKRQDYNVMNSKESKKALPIKKAFVNESGLLVLVNEGNGVLMPTSIDELQTALENLDAKFFTDEFSNSVRDFALKSAVKSRLNFILKSGKNSLDAANKNFELVEQTNQIDSLISSKQQEREKVLNKQAIYSFVSAVNSSSKTANLDSSNTLTKS